MFLSNSSLIDVVKTQVKYKLNAFIGALISLIFLQLLGLYFSLNATSSMGSNINNASININIISVDPVIMLVVFWAFFVGNLMTTKAYRYDDFSFVSTRLSSNLANIIVLFMMSVFAGVTTLLSSFLLRVILLLFGKLDYVKTSGLLDDPLNSLVTIVVITILILTAAAGAYLVGMLVQISRVFILVLPVLILSLLITKSGQSILHYVFLDNNTNLILIVKLICVALIFFGLAALSSNRLEVRL